VNRYNKYTCFLIFIFQNIRDCAIYQYNESDLSCSLAVFNHIKHLFKCKKGYYINSVYKFGKIKKRRKKNIKTAIDGASAQAFQI
jgi:hypothetical protein